MPRYRRYTLPDRPVFVTVVTHEREPWLKEPRNAERLLGAMRDVKAHHSFRHLAHVIQPDHFHWLFVPQDRAGMFSQIVSAVKLNVTRSLKERGLDGPFWQRRFYDHLIRDQRDLQRHLDYIHFNPVKHGLVSAAEDHPYSSFGEWLKRGVYEAGWGTTPPPSIEGMELE